METRIVTILACMELLGISVNLKSLQELLSVVSSEMLSLETKAYDLAGRKFNFLSSKEVGQVREPETLNYTIYLIIIMIYVTLHMCHV